MLTVISYKLAYLFIRVCVFPFSLLSYKQLHRVCYAITPCLFPLLKKYRKRSLSNLALAKDLQLSNEEIVRIAKKSLSNLLITALEYAKLAKEPQLENLVHCNNPDIAADILKKGQGIVFFCAHQANWELLFLDGTSRMPGTAIGRAIKNHFLYDWVLKIRQRFGGKIITPKNAFKESLRALKQGRFVGIVGDQGMPESGFSSLFLGRLAWTSPLPALLAYRTNSPLFFATTHRLDGSYEIVYSDPIYPNSAADSSEEIPRLMNAVLHLLEKSIKERPGQWLWQHNRWKQAPRGKLKKVFRHDAIAILLPEDPSYYLPYLSLFRTLYPTEWLMLMAQSSYKNELTLPVEELHLYDTTDELFICHYGPKLVFNFSQVKGIKNHFLKLSAFTVFDLADLQKLAPQEQDFSVILTKASGYAL